MTVSGTGEERRRLCVFFLGIMLVSGTGGGARVLAIGSTRCGRAPEVATAEGDYFEYNKLIFPQKPFVLFF